MFTPHHSPLIMANLHPWSVTMRYCNSYNARAFAYSPHPPNIGDTWHTWILGPGALLQPLHIRASRHHRVLYFTSVLHLMSSLHPQTKSTKNCSEILCDMTGSWNVSFLAAPAAAQLFYIYCHISLLYTSLYFTSDESARNSVHQPKNSLHLVHI